MKSVRNSSAGFSLVELMVVVAIIGILATIAVPQVNKFMAKARQSEAKGNLSTLYSTQKAFFAEYQTYYGGIQETGYSPEGDIRYRIGFLNLGRPTATELVNDYGYPKPIPNVSVLFNTNAYCAANASCNELSDANIAMSAGSVVASPPGNAAETFVAEAATLSVGYNIPDRWTIDQMKRVRNPVSGIQ